MFDKLFGNQAHKIHHKTKLNSEQEFAWKEVVELKKEYSAQKRDIRRIERLMEIKTNQFWLELEEEMDVSKYSQIEIDDDALELEFFVEDED